MTENIQETELDLLKQEAKTLGMTFHPSIGLEKLKINLNEFKASEVEVTTPVPKRTAIPTDAKERIIETPQSRKLRKRKEANRLVRVRITNMNPNKRGVPGEILTISNSAVGTIKKYVPFDNQEGWHIPYMMYLHLKERQCQIFVKSKGARGNDVSTPKLINEFAIELLPNLTENEIKDLAQRQAMASGTQV